MTIEQIYSNRYKVINQLGRGMAGIVFRARDEQTGNECALKILPLKEKKPTRAQLQQYRDEFDVLKNLNHPYIVKVLDAGFDEGKYCLYLVSELVHGTDLFKATEGLPPYQIEELLIMALRAFTYLHEKGVLHLDIKPQNLLVDKQGGKLSLKVIDFGLANFYKQAMGPSGTQTVVGTPAYVAPEIVCHQVPDHRADLYSLGATFYRVFTRELLFDAKEPEEFYEKHRTTVPKKPTAWNKNLPSYLDEVLLKLLEKNPDKRYPNATAAIKDISLLSGKSYAVETIETSTSYLPEKGELIGRKEEKETFLAFFNDRFQSKQFKKKPYLIISGEEGTGKTRFLDECRHEALKHLVKMITWDTFLIPTTDELPLPLLVYDDKNQLDESDLERLDLFYGEKPILFLFTTEDEKFFVSSEYAGPMGVVHLHPFTLEETKVYLNTATGIKNIPDWLIDSIHQRTLGNPFYLAEETVHLLEQGFFRDAQGSWSPKKLEDLKPELERTVAAGSIKQRLKQNLEAFQLDKGQEDILCLFALTGKPTTIDLVELSKPNPVEENLLFFIRKGILKVDVGGGYRFSNPLYRDVLIENMDPHDEAIRCDKIGEYLSRQGADPHIILYYRGRGNSPEAAFSLLKLAKIRRKEALYEKAKENLLYLVEKKKQDSSLYKEALLELGEIGLETGKPAQAQNWLESLIKSYEEKGKITKEFILIKAYEQLGLSFKRREQYDKSTFYYQQGLSAVQQDPDWLWMEVVLNNRLAVNEFFLGNTDAAETIFNEAWHTWKNKLNEEEKMLAIRNDIDTFYYEKGDYQKAIVYLEELFEVVERQSHSDTYPIICYKLGRAYLRNGDIPKAALFLLRCREILKERKTPYWLYIVYNELGNLKEKEKQTEEALSYYQHAFDLACKLSYGIQRYFIIFNIGNLYLNIHHFKEAEKYFLFCIKNLRLVESAEALYTVHHLFLSFLGLSVVYRQQNLFEKALASFRQAEDLLKKKDFLKFYEQYFWQEKADLAKAQGNRMLIVESLKKLEELQKEPKFNQQEYENWKKSFDYEP